MHQERVVQDLEVVVQDAQRVPLRHLVALALPAEALVVQRVAVGPDEDRLPVDEVAQPLADVEHPQAPRFGHGRADPLLGFRHVVAAGAHFLVEWNRRAVP